MSFDSQDHGTLRRYLLGELSDEEQSREEERFLTDRDYFERLLLVEDDLMDEYVSGMLSHEERERVERRFLLSPKRQERVSLAGNLRRYAIERPAIQDQEQAHDKYDLIPFLSWPRKRVNALLVPCAVVAMIIAAAILFREMASLRNRIDTLNSGQQAAEQRGAELSDRLTEQVNRSESLQQRLEQEQTRRIQLSQLSDLKQSLSAAQCTDDSRIISLSLIPGRLRDGGQPSINQITGSIEVLRLELSLESAAILTTAR
jgi:Tfp pilus assembly protein PilN